MVIDKFDKCGIMEDQDKELKQALDKIDWPIYYGNVRIQIREGKVTLVTIERTIRLD